MSCHDYILESLCNELHCAYLSDLSHPSCRPQLKHYLLNADMDIYSVDAWDYAFSYIFGHSSGATTPEECKTCFLQHL